MKFAADFETITNPYDCRVWAWGIYVIDGYDEFIYGNTLEGFMQWVSVQKSPTIYFHNLKFDGEFIISYLLNNNYTWVKTKRLYKNKTFKTLISDKGVFYCMEIQFENGVKAKIYDSLKIIPLSIKKIPEAFGLPMEKGEIDYEEYREVGHELTEDEINYLKHDVEIAAKALSIMFKQGMHKMTAGSNALANYKDIVGKNIFKKWYPVPSYDEDVRRSYKGGFVYCNPVYQGKDIGDGIVLDVNSLYPSRMYYEMLPYGEGIAFEGKYKKDKDYPLFVQLLKCNFKLKKNHIPTIQLKNSLGFNPTEYAVDSGGEDVQLCLTSVDLKLFFEHYNVRNKEWGGGWKFRCAKGMFKDYIDKWYKVKEEAGKEGNKGLRQIAKLMLNSLYGKFATNPNVQSKIPYLDEDGVVRYKPDDPETREAVYIPMGTFITAYARNVTIRAAQKCYDRFLYADTDSLHLIGTDLPDGLEIDDNKLGAWAHEKTFTRARFLRAKTYAEEVDGKMCITCAGMPEACYPNVTWDNFHTGTVYQGKLMQRHVKGGIVLVPTTFKIKEDKK